MSVDYENYPVQLRCEHYGWLLLHYDAGGWVRQMARAPSLKAALVCARRIAVNHSLGMEALVGSPWGRAVIPLRSESSAGVAR